MSGKNKAPNVLEVTERPEVSKERLVAELAFKASTLNANTGRQFAASIVGELTLMDSIAVFREIQNKVVVNNNTKPLEHLLTSQALALNSIFNSLAIRAKENIGHYPETVERYMKLALKAQSQCRSTIEAINEIKNQSSAPTFVKQANIGNAVQVNNGQQNLTSTHAGARTGKTQTEPNKLLAADQPATLPTFTGGVINDLDSRKASAAG